MPYGTLALDAIQTSGNLTITGNTVTTGALVASNMPGRNRLINGAMMVDQRNSGNARTILSSATTVTYTVDRWYAYSTGANVTGQQVTGSVSNTYNYRFTGAASVTGIGFGQRIEALNSADLAGTTATLSVDLANSVLTTVTWTAFYANTTNTFGNISTPTRTQIATGTFTVTSTVTRYSTQIAVPAAATTGIDIVFSVGAQTSGTWTVGNAQFEAGAFATPFERRLIGQEIPLCQRYYYQVLASNTAGGNRSMWGGYVRGSTSFEGFYRPFPVPMRATPNFSYTGAVGNYNVYNGSTAGACSSITVSDIDAYGSILTVATVQTYTVGTAGQFYAPQGNNLVFSSEL